MKRSVGVTILSCVISCALVLAGCGHRTSTGAAVSPPLEGGESASGWMCADKTYRLGVDRVDSELKDSCERVKQSRAALDSYRATIQRFTCQKSDGHVVMSVLVPKDQFDDYGILCNEYLSNVSSADPASRREANAKLTAGGNQLVRRHMQQDEALFRQAKADRTTLNRLVKERGGAIEIED